MKARKSKHVATIESPTKGVALYRTATKGLVFYAHWSADPLKTEEWADMVASDEPGGRQSVTYLQEFEADDDAKSGERIYWAFDRERNVVRREDVFPTGIPKDWPVSLGADFGQKAPTAILFTVQDPKSRRVYVFDSIYRPRGIDVAVKLEVYEKIGRHFDVPLEKLALEGLTRYIDKAVPDPTAAPYIDYYAEEPWPVYFTLGKNEAVKGSRKRGPAESLVNKLLWPSFVCCEKLTFPSRGTEDEPDEPPESAPCPLCGKENRLLPMVFVLEGASEELCNQWEDLVDVEARFDGFESPEKSTGLPDHACFVAGTLVETPAGQRPIESIRAGDMVQTHLGPRAVLKAGMSNPDAALVTIGGLTGTPDHPIMTTNRGWVRLDALRYSDIVVGCESRPSFSTATSSVGTQKRKAVPSASTTRPASRQSSAEPGASTKKSGKRRTDRFPSAASSITGTKTRSTTASTTSKPKMLGFMPQSTASGDVTQDASPPWSVPVRLPPLGMPRKRVGHGTPSTGSESPRSRRSARLSAKSAAEPTSPRCPSSSAQATAGRQTDAAPRKTTRAARASTAGLTSWRVGTPLPSAVREDALRPIAVPAGRGPVYALTVADAHTFFAAGILVSNCDAFKYLAVDMEIDPEHALTEKEQSALSVKRLREKAPYERTTEDLIALHFAKVADRMQRERDFLDGKHQGRRIMASRWGFGRRVTYSTPDHTPRAQA